MTPSRFALIIPTLNARADWAALIKGLREQSVQPDRFLIIDSSSTDGTAELARAEGAQCIVIPRSEFNHGLTRQKGVDLVGDCELVVFLTQDCVLASSDSLKNLVAAFEDPATAAAYGRQLPRPGAGPFEYHLRTFNYGAQSEVRSLSDVPRLGLKAIFISNSFACYRRSSLLRIGGFPGDLIMGEDTYAAAKFLLRGEKVAYVAEAIAYHSHDYTIAQDFCRYFDIGVVHARAPWLLERFGSASGTGFRYVASEIRKVLSTQPWRLPEALVRHTLKFIGYQLGRREAHFSADTKRRLSMHKFYWDSPQRGQI